MRHLAPGDIVGYQKDEYQPLFSTLEEHTKDTYGGNTWKIRDWGQEENIEAVEDLLNKTESPSKSNNQLGGYEQGCGWSQVHEGGHGQSVINLGTFGTGKEGVPVLV